MINFRVRKGILLGIGLNGLTRTRTYRPGKVQLFTFSSRSTYNKWLLFPVADDPCLANKCGTFGLFLPSREARGKNKQNSEVT